MALLYFTKVIAPSVWGWLADNKIDRVKVVQLGTFLSLASFSLVFLSHSLILLACMMFLFSFFWNAILPQLEAITLSALQENPDRYSKIRLWGSIGFIAATMGGGYYLDRFGIHYLPTLCFCGAGLLAACTFGLKIKGRTLEARARKVDRFRQYFKCREVWCFILVCFFMQLSFGPYYSFMYILIEGK